MAKKLEKTKFIFVTGGVYSSLGKGVTASSIGRLLKELGYTVAMQKLDPYLNVNPENISPLQHGEVYITADGLQTDLDLGNYERFIDLDLNRYSSMTSGRIYSEVLAKENEGAYGGKTIQVIPHITGHIIENFHNLAKTLDPDFIIVEIGGTVGDIESMPFFETISIFAYEYGKENVLFAHCVPLITLATVYGEMKTKPAQHSLRTLRSLGVSPDLVLLRTSCDVDHETIEKLSRFSNIHQDAFFVAPNLDSIYYLPEVLFSQGIHKKIFEVLSVPGSDKYEMNHWGDFTKLIKSPKTKTLRIGILGEYVDLHDAYFSMIEAAKISSYAHNFKIEFVWIHPQDFEKCCTVDGVIFGGGEDPKYNPDYEKFFQLAIEQNLVVLGYFKGFFNWAKIHGLVVDQDQSYGEKTSLISDDLLQKAYRGDVLMERHQHKEGVRKFLPNEKYAMAAVRDDFVDVIKVLGNDFFYVANFDPEFKTRPLKPSPLIDVFFQKILERE